jgi:peptide/nickel transport system substrate-binding protein
MPQMGPARGGPARVSGRVSHAAAARGLKGLALSSLLLALLCAAAVAAGCGGSGTVDAAAAPSPATAPRSGGTFAYPLQVDVDSLLPFRARDSIEVPHQIFEGLVAYETRADGTVVTSPCLAESWVAGHDATVWTFRLRRGVRFQQPVGREVTAADVVAAFRFSALSRNHALAAYMYAIVEGTDREGHVPASRADRLGVEALDRYTVRFTLKHPFAAFADTLGGASGWVWPVDYLERVGPEGFEAQPVGTGPFVVSRRVRGEYIDLTRNPGWWNAASGRPYLESVHFQVFKSVAAELQAFQQGFLDYTWVPQGQVAASRSLPQVQDGEWVPVVLPQEAAGYVCFDMDDAVTGGEQGLALRRAIDAVIDRRALVAEAGPGVLIPQTGLVPRVFPGWEDEQPAQALDLGSARELHVQAGRPALTLTFAQDRLGASVAEYIRGQCAAAGISVRLKQIPWDRWQVMFGRERIPDFYLTGWASDYPGYDNFLYEPFVSSLSSFSLGTGYADPDVDRLLTLARSTTDRAAHLDLSRRAAHEILADKPVLPLFEFADYRLLNARIGGFSVDPMYGVDTWKLWVK